MVILERQSIGQRHHHGSLAQAPSSLQMPETEIPYLPVWPLSTMMAPLWYPSILNQSDEFI